MQAFVSILWSENRIINKLKCENKPFLCLHNLIDVEKELGFQSLFMNDNSGYDKTKFVLTLIDDLGEHHQYTGRLDLDKSHHSILQSIKDYTSYLLSDDCEPYYKDGVDMNEVTFWNQTVIELQMDVAEVLN